MICPAGPRRRWSRSGTPGAGPAGRRGRRALTWHGALIPAAWCRISPPGRAVAARASSTARGQGLAAIPADVLAPLEKAFRHGVLLGLKEARKNPGRKQEPFRELLQCPRGRHADALRFTTGLRIPPTSNQAGRDLRPARTQQKISGRLRSEAATRHRHAIRGHIDTAAKHGISALTAIHDALAGNPWMPPIPDPP